MKSKALFLDRDGVVNKEINYLYRIEDCVFINGIFEVSQYFQQKGYKIFIITNQAGIARGYYTEQDYNIFTDWMIQEFSKKGIVITKVYHCPHHPSITGECLCRKPNPMMIKLAEKEYNIDLQNSILIGDKISDIEAGKNAEIGLSILVKTNSLFALKQIFPEI